jgi:hypothetical protein
MSSLQCKAMSSGQAPGPSGAVAVRVTKLAWRLRENFMTSWLKSFITWHRWKVCHEMSRMEELDERKNDSDGCTSGISLQNILYNYRFHSVSISVFTLMESKSDHWIPRNRSPRNRFHVIWTAAHHQRSNHLCFHGTANHGCACRTQLAYPMIVFFCIGQ